MARAKQAYKIGSGGIEKSHSCKWAKWIQWHALPHIQQSTQQWNKGYYPNLHGWDFSIPPSPQNPRDRGTAGPRKKLTPQKISKTEKKKKKKTISEKNENVKIS